MAGQVGPTFPCITKGLVFCFDPANKLSYPVRTGTTGTNMQTPKQSGTFSSTNMFDSAESSTIAFDNSNFINFGHDSSLNFGTGEFTVLCWVGGLPSYPGAISTIIWKGSRFDGNVAGWSIAWANSPQDAYFIISSASSRTEGRTNPNSGLNGWSGFKMIGMQRSGTNWNQIVDTTVTTLGNFSGNVDNTEDLLIAKNGFYNGYLNANIGPVLIYNRALSSTEITKNYNRLKGRFE
jgi:hypothetical protein